MNSHTPGPWGLPDDGKPFVSAQNVNGTWNGIIARVDAGDYARSLDEGMANARLIAAAPDMLEALKAVLTWSDQANPAGYGGLLQHLEAKIEAAIVKAEDVK